MPQKICKRMQTSDVFRERMCVCDAAASDQSDPLLDRWKALSNTLTRADRGHDL